MQAIAFFSIIPVWSCLDGLLVTDPTGAADSHPPFDGTLPLHLVLSDAYLSLVAAGPLAHRDVRALIAARRLDLIV